MFDRDTHIYSMKKFITINDKYLYAGGIRKIYENFYDFSDSYVNDILTSAISGMVFYDTLKNLCHNVDYEFAIMEVSIPAKDAKKWCDENEELDLKSMNLIDLLITLTQSCVCLKQTKDEINYEYFKCSYEKIPYLNKRVQTCVYKISQCLGVLKSRFMISFPDFEKELLRLIFNGGFSKMKYKLYVFHDVTIYDPITCWFSVNDEKVYRYIAPTIWKEFELPYCETRFKNEHKPVAEFKNRKDLFDVMYFLTGDENSKKYKKILENEKLQKYFQDLKNLKKETLEC